MAKDGYFFYCSKCKFDHAGECEANKPETDKSGDGRQWHTIPLPAGIGAWLPKDWIVTVSPPVDKP